VQPVTSSGQEIAANVEAVTKVVGKMREIGLDLRNLADQLDDLWRPEIFPPDMQQGSASIVEALNRAVTSLVERAGYFEQEADVLQTFAEELQAGENQDIANYDATGEDLAANSEQYQTVVT
jgi:hypothetical protein